MSLPWRVTPAGVEVAVKVTPRAGRDAVGGIATEADGKAWLTVKVSAPPENGRANEAVTVLLTRALHLPGSAGTVVSGRTARRKRVLLRGDAVAIAQTLRELLDTEAGRA